jgi:hypothetical protein
VVCVVETLVAAEMLHRALCSKGMQIQTEWSVQYLRAC